MRRVAKSREGAELKIYSLASLLSAETLKSIDEVPNSGHWPKAVYYKCFAADVLPRDARKALYLDSDIVCTGSLGELFATDLKGLPAAMCLDPPNLRARTYNRLGYPSAEGYFNTGVILFDLDVWRKENLGRKLIDWLMPNGQKIVIADQDAINAVLHGRILPLDFSNNIMPCCFYVFYWLEEEKNGYFASETQDLPKDEWPALLAAVEAPRLVHMTISKPWYKESNHPFAPVWRYFYCKSPWKDEPFQYHTPRTAKLRLKQAGRKVFEKLGLMAKAPSLPYPPQVYKIAQRELERLLAEYAARN